MDILRLGMTLIVWLGLIILIVIYRLYRRQLARAYAAGRAAALEEQNLHERHGLAALPAPEDVSTT